MRGRSFVVAAAAAMLIWPSRCERPAGHWADGDAGLRVHHAQVEPGRGGDRLPDRAHAGGRGRDGRHGAIVGVWQPQRTITPNAAVVRGLGLPARRPLPVARAGAARHREPAAVLGAGRRARRSAIRGPEELLTAYEKAVRPDRPGRGSTRRTAEEADFTAKLDAASDRMRVVELARTLQNRPMNMFIIGYPTPPATAHGDLGQADLAINCNVHGNEASGRESCFTMARQLALSTRPGDPGMLSQMTVLMVPSINADGRAANTRGNTTGQDLNRDHALIEQNETKGFAPMIRDYTPDVIARQPRGRQRGPADPRPPATSTCTSPCSKRASRWSTSGCTAPPSQSGWWMGPYSTGGDSHEGILRNTASLKNGVSMLGEARAAPGPPVRPRAAPTRAPNGTARSTRTCGRTGRACATSTRA